MSAIVVSGDATPFITNKFMPKGGVVTDISILMSTNKPNHNGLMAKA